MINRLLAQQLYTLTRQFAADCVHNQQPASFKNVRTLIINGSELLNECIVDDATATAAAASSADTTDQWKAELRRIVCTTLVPLWLLNNTNVSVLVICFDAATPHPARVTHPLQRQEHSTAFVTSAHQNKLFMRRLMGDPERCAALYYELFDAIASSAPLRADGSFAVVMDGLMSDASVYLIRARNGERTLYCSSSDDGFLECCFPRSPSPPDASTMNGVCAPTPTPPPLRMVERSNAWITADAADRAVAWAALHSTYAAPQHECVVQCANVYTLLKLLAWADVDALTALGAAGGGERRTGLWFSHRFAAERREYACGDSGTSRYKVLELNEYIDVHGVCARLQSAYSRLVERVAPSKLFTPLLAMLVLLTHDSSVRVLDTDIGALVAEIATRRHSYCSGMLRAAVHGERALGSIGADVDVCVDHAAFLGAMTAVLGRSDAEAPRSAICARNAALLHRLYNSHLPWYEELDDELAREFGFARDAAGRPCNAANVALMAEYSVRHAMWRKTSLKNTMRVL